MATTERLESKEPRKLRGKDPILAKPARPQTVVFGPPGIGKTWTALDFPDCYYIDCEGGANLPHYTKKLKDVGAIYLGPEDGANDFDVVIQEIMTLATTKHDRKTLIIDSFSKLYGTAVQIEYDRMLAHGERPAFANERKPAIACTRRMMRWLGELDMNVLIICHQKTKWVNGESVGDEPDFWDKMAYDCNLVLQVYRTGQTRRCRVIKSRFESFPESDTLDWSYAEFANRFGRDVLESDPVAIELATSIQVARIKDLVDILRIGDDDVAKVFDDAGVTRWEDMTSKRIATAISNLEKRIKQS